MAEKEEALGNQLAEVWNDIVKVRDLALAIVMGILFGMTFFLLARHTLLHFQWGDRIKGKGMPCSSGSSDVC